MKPTKKYPRRETKVKNKKLFAILTLVCFMFTLMPVAAFAVPATEPQFVEFSDDTESKTVDYDKLITIEERKLERAKQAFLAEIDTLEQYAKNKADITARINELIAKRDEASPNKQINPEAYAKRVIEVVDFIQRPDVTDKAKNEALRTIIDKVVFEKAKGNLAIYFTEL